MATWEKDMPIDVTPEWRDNALRRAAWAIADYRNEKPPTVLVHLETMLGGTGYSIVPDRCSECDRFYGLYCSVCGERDF